MQFDWENFTYDAEWLQEAVQIEAKAGSDLQIGGNISSSAPSIAPSQLQTQLKQVRLQSRLFGELRSLMMEADLGVGTEAALTEGRRLIRARLQHLTPEQHEYFEALSALDVASSEAKPLLAGQQPAICTLLTQTDWQQIAQAAMGSIQACFQQIALR